MSTHRLVREIALFVAVAGGAVIGYCAGQYFDPALDSTARAVCSFVGFSIFGAFADFCIRGGK